MDEALRRRNARFETYGNVAYAPAWRERAGAGADVGPGPGEITRARPRVRPRERTLARPKVQVRQAGKVSPLAVVGFLAVGALAVLLLVSCVRLTVINDETVRLRGQLDELKAEETKLLTQYETAYDLRAIEAELTASGAMIKPNSGQIVALDLSEPDNVVVYGRQDEGPGLLDRLAGIWKGLLPRSQ